jgi:type I restriction enzyme S subunit
MLLDIRPDHLALVKSILQRWVPKLEVWAFGSRAKWTAKDHSDLDVCIMTSQPLSFEVMGHLQEAFSDSDLPYKVDVVDWSSLSKAFQAVIAKDKVVMQPVGRVSPKGITRQVLDEAAVGGEDVGLRCANPTYEGWKSTTLGQICAAQGGAIQTGPFGSQLHTSDYKEVGVPVVMPTNIGDGGIVLDGIARIDQSDVERLPQHKLKLGDIVFSRRGDVTKNALIRSHEVGFFCGTGCLKVRLGNESIANAKFISHCLRLPDIKDWLVRHAVGATMPNLNTGILSAVPIDLPPLQIQLEIASMLGALDDRITLLRETNATLEAIAQALFKSWFVDFDPVRAKMEGRAPEGMDEATAALFSDGLEESVLGLVPRGWFAIPIYDLATYINGAAYKAFEPNTEGLGRPIIKIAELKSGVTSQTAYSDVAMPEKYLIQTRDILFSWSGNPDTSIDTFVWTFEPAWLNQHIFRVLPRAPMERTFVLQLLRHLKPLFTELARNKQTTGLGHVTVADMKRELIPMPTTALLGQFDLAVGPIHARIFENQKQAQTLATLRDTLLPRLISGQLRLPEALTTVAEQASA